MLMGAIAPCIFRFECLPSHRELFADALPGALSSPDCGPVYEIRAGFISRPSPGVDGSGKQSGEREKHQLPTEIREVIYLTP